MATFRRNVFKECSLQKHGFSFSNCPQEPATFEVNGAKEIKPFDSIPGPKSLPLLGTLWKYFPLIGKYYWNNNDNNNKGFQYNNFKLTGVLPCHVTADSCTFTYTVAIQSLPLNV